jgi:hypothetical protein
MWDLGLLHHGNNQILQMWWCFMRLNINWVPALCQTLCVPLGYRDDQGLSDLTSLLHGGIWEPRPFQCRAVGVSLTLTLEKECRDGFGLVRFNLIHLALVLAARARRSTPLAATPSWPHGAAREVEQCLAVQPERTVLLNPVNPVN